MTSTDKSSADGGGSSDLTEHDTFHTFPQRQRWRSTLPWHGHNLCKPGYVVLG
jgi:hypothetical protein